MASFKGGLRDRVTYTHIPQVVADGSELPLKSRSESRRPLFVEALRHFVRLCGDQAQLVRPSHVGSPEAQPDALMLAPRSRPLVSQRQTHENDPGHVI